MPPKKNKADFVFNKKSNETLVKTPGQLNGSDFAIRNCENCEIYICDHLAQIFVDDCKNCKVFIGPTKGSVFLRDSSNIEIHCAAQQFRVSDSQNVVACVFSQSDPALENVKALKIAPFNFVYNNIAAHFAAAQLDVTQDKWSQVFDFTPAQTGPRNWEILDPKFYDVELKKEFEGVEGDFVNPVPRHQAYGGTIEEAIVIGSTDPNCKEEGGGMMSFSIQVNQNTASEQFEQTTGTADPQVQEELKNLDSVLMQSSQTIETPQQSQFTQQDTEFFGQQSTVQDGFGWDQGAKSTVQDAFDWDQGNQSQSQQFNNNNNNNQQQDDFFGAATNTTTTQSHLQLMEIEFAKRIRAIQDEEAIEKNKRKAEARQYLQEFAQKRASQIQLQKKQNRELAQSKAQEKSKLRSGESNPWKFICSNIATKTGEYPGKKDVTRMRDAIVNKSQDNFK